MFVCFVIIIPPLAFIVWWIWGDISYLRNTQTK